MQEEPWPTEESASPKPDAPALEAAKVACPACGAILAVPAGTVRRVAKCGQCKQKFWLPQEATVSDEEVARWLGDRESDEDPLGDLSGQGGRYPEVVPPEAAAALAHDTLAPAPAPSHNLRLASCDRNGALLEFPARRLNDKPFRCAMPRICMQCGARTHLEAHVIIFSGMLVDSVSLEAEHAAGKLILRCEEAKSLSSEDVVDRLGRVPNVPAPADQPMPYWLCDMCAISKAISGQFQINTETNEGTCRLLIRNLRRAEEFLAAIGARGTGIHRELVNHIAVSAENSWELLPLAIQHRIEQWFRPSPGEQFLTYVPDRDHARTEDGMHGLIVSNRRLVHHTRMRHREIDAAQSLEIALSFGKKKGELVVQLPAWSVHITVDGDGIAKLRRSMVQGRYRVTWR